MRHVVARGNDRNNIKLWGERSSLINGLAVDAGIDAWAPADDLDGHLRDDHPDISPYEW